MNYTMKFKGKAYQINAFIFYVGVTVIMAIAGFIGYLIIQSINHMVGSLYLSIPIFFLLFTTLTIDKQEKAILSKNGRFIVGTILLIHGIYVTFV